MLILNLFIFPHIILLRLLLGPEEIRENNNSLNRQSRVVKYYGFVTEILSNLSNFVTKAKSNHRNKLYVFMKTFEEKIDRFFNRLSIQKTMKHQACNHRYSCWLYSLNVSFYLRSRLKKIFKIFINFKGFITRFFGGFVLQAGIKIAGSLIQILKKPALLKKILTNPANVELGLFFGSFNFIYRV